MPHKTISPADQGRISVGGQISIKPISFGVDIRRVYALGQSNGRPSHLFDSSDSIIIQFSMDVGEDLLGQEIPYLVTITNLEDNTVAQKIDGLVTTTQDNSGPYNVSTDPIPARPLFMAATGAPFFLVRVYTFQDGPNPISGKWVFSISGSV